MLLDKTSGMLAEFDKTLVTGHTENEGETEAYTLSDPLLKLSFRINKICMDGCWLGKKLGLLKDTVNWTLVALIT